MDKILNLRFFDIFDKNDEFYRTMVGVFTAREDVVNILKMMDMMSENDSKDCSKLMLTLFKMHVGVLKECSKLIYNNLFNETKEKLHSYERLKKFHNFEKINNFKKSLDNYSEKLKDKYSLIRNYSFHYDNQCDSGKYKELKMFFDSLEDFDIGIEVDTNAKETSYIFTFDVYLKYYIYVLNDIHGENVVMDFKDVADEVKKILELVFEIMDEICNGYLFGNDVVINKYKEFLQKNDERGENNEDN